MASPSPPRFVVVGYELEIRPCRGWWSRFEGRVVRLVQPSGAPKPRREHHLPDYGPTSSGRTFVTRQPYWARSRTRERLERKLCDALNEHECQRRARQAERIPLEHTMAGWQ